MRKLFKWPIKLMIMVLRIILKTRTRIYGDKTIYMDVTFLGEIVKTEEVKTRNTFAGIYW